MEAMINQEELTEIISEEEDRVLERLFETCDPLAEDLMTYLQHGICVSNIATLLARELNLPDSDCHEIAVAGVLHDIGKLKVSQYIYGRGEDVLEIEEMKYVRMHTTLGYHILKDAGYKDTIMNMILYHHENFDGTGYPNNLAGEEIPFEARIIRVCDVFVALISDRPYRKAFPVEMAIEMMIDEVKNFDMRIFLAFQRMTGSKEFWDTLIRIGYNMETKKLEEFLLCEK